MLKIFLGFFFGAVVCLPMAFVFKLIGADPFFSGYFTGMLVPIGISFGMTIAEEIKRLEEANKK